MFAVAGKGVGGGRGGEGVRDGLLTQGLGLGTQDMGLKRKDSGLGTQEKGLRTQE